MNHGHCHESQAAKGRVAAEEQLVVLREQGNALEQALAAEIQQTEREQTSAHRQHARSCSTFHDSCQLK